jgi:hypothetical protein
MPTPSTPSCGAEVFSSREIKTKTRCRAEVRCDECDGKYIRRREYCDKKGRSGGSSRFMPQNLQAVQILAKHRQRLGGFELLGFLQLFLCHVLVSSGFDLTAWRPRTLCTLRAKFAYALAHPRICKFCKEMLNLRFSMQPKESGCNVDLINRAMKYSTDVPEEKRQGISGAWRGGLAKGRLGPGDWLLERWL